MQFFDFHHHHIHQSFGIYNLDFGKTPPNQSYSIGIHPKDINIIKIDEQYAWLKENITQNCFAIGECGLDGLVSTEQKIQNGILKKHIEIANEFQKPLILHCVRKFSEIIPFKKFAQQKMIIHGFNKKQTIATELLKNNFYLSFGKAVLYNLSLQNVLKTTPLDKIFLETDNEDFNIEELYTKVSELKGISLEQLNDQILENLDTVKHG